MLVASCAQQQKHTVSVSDVLAKRESIVDRSVIVRGYLIFKPSAHNLWLSKDAYENYDEESQTCVSIFRFREHESKLLKLNGKNVEIFGTIKYIPLKDDQISFSECSNTGIIVKTVKEAD